MESCALNLDQALERLRAVQEVEPATEAAREVLEAARTCCDAPVNLAALTQAAEVLLEVLARLSISPSEPGASDRAADADGAWVKFKGVVHEFVDLARLQAVRRAAYPAEPNQPGGQWIEAILKLIERSDFTVGHLLRQRATQYPDKTLFVVPQGERVTEYSFRTVLEAAERIARALMALLGEDPIVALYTPNRVEGALVDLACLGHGIFNTMVPGNIVETQLEHILLESKTRLLVVSGAEQVQRALAVQQAVPSVEWIVTLDPLPTVPGAHVIFWTQFLERADEVPAFVVQQRLAGVKARQVATTMHTSGTTGLPKGIKFSHLNLTSKRYCRAAALPEIGEDDVFLCFLPLYHTFGRYLEMLGALHLGATYIFAESAATETLIHHMKQFQPTALISVPKKWADLHRRVAASDEPPDDPEEVGRMLRELTGGRLCWGLSAAGRLDPTIFRFFQFHGIDLLSGYGMTEATGGVTMTPPGGYLENSIGKALPGIELGFGEDLELKLRGPYVTEGYTNEDDNTEVFRDGWLCTGDVVSVDNAGYLRHVDRKKDIYKNASGRTIAPQRVEALFADFPAVARVFAVGDGREYVTLLIRPNLSYADVDFAHMPKAALREYFRGLVVECNRFLAPFERVVNFALIDRDFVLERGELTPKGSFRRARVEENFRDLIEPMYVSNTIDRVVCGLRVKVPIAFLQHIGATESGTRADDEGLFFSAINTHLRIGPDPLRTDRVWVGNCCYDCVGAVLELDDWLRLPSLWVGNAELARMAGDSILLWSLQRSQRDQRCRMVRIARPSCEVDDCVDRLEAAQGQAPGLLTVHAAAVALAGGETPAALRAVDFLGRVITSGWVRYEGLAEFHLRCAAQHADGAVRGRAFVALFEHQPAERFYETASAFCGSLNQFLDSEVCRRLAQIGFRPQHWSAFSQALAELRRRVTRTVASALARGLGEDAAEVLQLEKFILGLLRALGNVALLEVSFHLPVRRELTAWQLAPVPESISRVAAEVAQQLALELRESLGTPNPRAVDPAAGKAYTWADTLRFEDGIDCEEQARMTRALCDTCLVREAVYLLYAQRLIDLEDLEPGSVWISLGETRFGRSVYHAGVRLRSGERCDFTVYVRGAALRETFETDLHLMCLAAGVEGESPLTPQLGGYWPEYGLATLGHIPAEPVESIIRYMHSHPNHVVRQELKESWLHLAWSALAAAFEFYLRTERRWMLTGTVTRDIAVPLNDFEQNARVFSVAGWRPFCTPLDMIVKLKRAFLDRVRFHFPILAPETEDEVLFAAAIEVLGLDEGTAFLAEALAEAEQAQGLGEETEKLCGRIKTYVEAVRESGYMPRTLHFAIARYHAWAGQVPEADVHTRAAQLRELQHNYGLDVLARKFPATRLRLYAETVLRDSPGDGRTVIESAIQRLRAGDDIKEVLGRLYHDLRDKLPGHDQQYFLTRAAYPHLELDEKAELVITLEAGPSRAELVTVHLDRVGKELRVRPAADAREVDRLHRIFHAGGLGGGYTGGEKLLVVVDQLSYVVGGAAYIRRTPGHVLLEKIAVMQRCRGRGIGQLLLQEFIRRQAAEGVTLVSAEFIRASWLSQFGFKSHPRCAGVVHEIR